MRNNDSAIKRYIRSIGCELPSGKMRNRVITQIRDSIFAYIQEHPEADVEAVQSHFGTPQEIAASYVNELDASALLKKMSIKKKVLVIVAGVMAAFLLMWISFVSLETIDSQKTNHGQVGVTTGQE